MPTPEEIYDSLGRLDPAEKVIDQIAAAVREARIAELNHMLDIVHSAWNAPVGKVFGKSLIEAVILARIAQLEKEKL